MPKRFEQIVVAALVVGLGCLSAIAHAQEFDPRAPKSPPSGSELGPAVPDKAIAAPNDHQIDLFAPHPTSATDAPAEAPNKFRRPLLSTPDQSVRDVEVPVLESIPLPARVRTVRRVRTVVELVREPVPKVELDELETLNRIGLKLKLAKGDKVKEAAVKELADLLQRYFDRDLERREQEIADVEGRVKRLRDQIEKRKAAKKEIVRLRLQTMVNEAEGLGFPSPDGDGQLPAPASTMSPFENPNNPSFSPRPAAGAPWVPSPPAGVPVPTPADEIRRPAGVFPAAPPQPGNAKQPPILDLPHT